jgi:DNA-binding transcriptional MerR regulator
MELKRSYSAREVAALTGLSARQLRWWNTTRLLPSSVASRRTDAGGFTERRYSPVEMIELMVLADLRRRGLSVGKLRVLLNVLRERFGVRLFETIGDGGRVTLLTDGREIYGRTAAGALFNLFKSPDQPLLVIGNEPELKQLTAKARRRRTKASRSGKPSRGRRRAAE